MKLYEVVNSTIGRRLKKFIELLDLTSKGADEEVLGWILKINKLGLLFNGRLINDPSHDSDSNGLRILLKIDKKMFILDELQENDLMTKATYKRMLESKIFTDEAWYDPTGKKLYVTIKYNTYFVAAPPKSNILSFVLEPVKSFVNKLTFIDKQPNISNMLDMHKVFHHAN